MSRQCPLCNGTGELPEAKRGQSSTLFDGHPETVELDQEPLVHNGARAAEQMAKLAIAPQAGTLRRRVLELAMERGAVGVTSLEATAHIVGEQLAARHIALGDDEFELAVRKKLYSIAPRLTELVDGEWLADSDDMRDRRMVYRATAKAYADGMVPA